MLNNDTCAISLLVERRISIPQGRVQFPYGAGYMNLPSRGVSVSTKSSNFIGCSKFLNDLLETSTYFMSGGKENDWYL